MENMKEAPKRKKLPPKTVGVTTTPTKLHNDEILSTLLRMNNFDSISSIKDESLDIDLSACVTISADSASVMNGNSFSSTDFWRMLDESAQNNQIDILSSSNGCDGLGIDSVGRDEHSNDNETVMAITKINAFGDDSSCKTAIKEEPDLENSFSLFLRPEPPSAHNSPLKRFNNNNKSLPADQQKQCKMKTSAAFMEIIENKQNNKQYNSSYIIKDELLEIHNIVEQPSSLKKDISSTVNVNVNVNNVNNTNNDHHQNVESSISSNKLKVFLKNIEAAAAAAVTAAATGNKKETELTEFTSNEEGPVSMYKCLDCNGLILRGLQEFKTHELVSHHIMFKCTDCDRDFEQEASLKKHLKSHRSVESRKDSWKKCPDCGKCLKLGSMWMHRKIHSDNKKYSCDVCGQKFVQKINLTHHSRVHTAEKPYECPECQKRFQERSHLQRHQKYHAQTRSYRCDKCGKMYKTERCLKVHNLVHLEQRPFACNVCDKSFISNSKLKQHSNIHTGERPFKCNYCPRDFTNFPNWLKHTRRRHKVDHKTGEHLENIPSYCSKKSTKTTKTQKDKNNETAAARQKSNETNKICTISNNFNQLQNQNQNQNNLIKETTQTTTTTTTATGAATTKVQTTTISTTTTTTTTSGKKKKENTTNNNNTNSGTLTVKKGLLAVEVNQQQQNEVEKSGNQNGIINQTTINNNKTLKVKRERKQLTPKQVQQKAANVCTTAAATAGTSPLNAKTKKTENNKTAVAVAAANQCIESASNATIIPTTTTTTTTTINNINDIHCLSITSAEELIMEQALEMEESGLFDGPIVTNVVTTDNAISSEAAAALHFKIENDFLSVDDVKQEEEFISLKNSGDGVHVLCSSLESSPFSSPASIDLAVSKATIGQHELLIPGTALYIPSTFSIAPTGTFISAKQNANAQVFDAASLQILDKDSFNNSRAQLVYYKPLQIQTQKQALPLPSVDTLLFSTTQTAAAAAATAANTNNLFHSNKIIKQQNMS